MIVNLLYIVIAPLQRGSEERHEPAHDVPRCTRLEPGRPASGRRRPSVARRVFCLRHRGRQGLTLVHFSASREHFFEGHDGALHHLSDKNGSG